MIAVDSSVWIDFLHGTETPQTLRLEQLLPSQRIAIPDLALTEVLQGIRGDRQMRRTRLFLLRCESLDTNGRSNALAAADNYRFLRAHGITIRKTVGTLIATACIRDDVPLLSNDRDFVPFVEHLGLRDAMVV